ncbi:unnamed protein product, partial [Adineta ricciae]
MFSLNDFPHLQSLTLTDINSTNMDQLVPMLTYIPSLKCFHLNNPKFDPSEIISSLYCSEIRTLTLPQLPKNLTLLRRFSSLKSLTIDSCSIYQLLQVLNDLSTLEYLQINYLSTNAGTSDRVNFKFTHCLRHLVINHTDYGFGDIEMIIRHTPNLNLFTLFASFRYDQMNVQKWKHSLRIYLSHLKVFKFCYQYNYKRDHRDRAKETLRVLQNDFQDDFNNGLIEYVLSQDTVMIYTVPYAFSTFQLHLDMGRYRNTALDDGNTFSNVRKLTIHGTPYKMNNHFYFFYNDQSPEWSPYRENMFNCLTMTSNFSHVKHLDASHVFNFENPSIFLEILKNTPELSSLTISFKMLRLSLDNDELCQSLKRMIHQLCITNSWSFSYDSMYEKFCNVFSNIEQLTCSVEKECQMMHLLTSLPRLICADFTVTKCDGDDRTSWSNTRLSELGMEYLV